MTLRPRRRWAGLAAGCALVLAGAAGESAVRAEALGSPTRVARCLRQWPPPASKPRSGAAAGATEAFGLFRRAGGQADQLPATDKSLGQALRTQLGSYDPALTRRITATPPETFLGTGNTYVVVGRGAARETELRHMPCAQRLSSRERRQLEAVFRVYIRPLTPSGPAFCLVHVAQLVGHDRGHISLQGACETFADAAKGFGAIQVNIHRGPFWQGLVPDGVSLVLLHYRGHAAISAPVSDNAFWARVPRLAPLESGPDPARSDGVRKAVLKGLPTSIDWLASNARRLRQLLPPGPYVRRLMRRYQACRVMECPLTHAGSGDSFADDAPVMSR